jgi:hypothetical protein
MLPTEKCAASCAVSKFSSSAVGCCRTTTSLSSSQAEYFDNTILSDDIFIDTLSIAFILTFVQYLWRRSSASFLHLSVSLTSLLPPPPCHLPPPTPTPTSPPCLSPPPTVDILTPPLNILALVDGPRPAGVHAATVPLVDPSPSTRPRTFSRSSHTALENI